MSGVSFVQRVAGLSRLLAAFVVVALIAAVIVGFNRGEERKTVTVDFPQTIALYEGSDVRVMGVPMGTVDRLQAEGDIVRATISYDASVKLPANVRAVIVSPAIVGDRFVQMAPVYTSGAELKDGAKIDVDRTAVPVELDEVYGSLNELSRALGPNGANRNGALSDLVSDSARQLEGQGAQLNETIQNFGKLSTTLADNSDDLFGSVREVSQFVDLLKRNDQVVRSFNDNTAGVADLLADESADLQGVLKTLSQALVDVESLVRDNRTTLRDNVANLRVLADTLAARQGEIDELTVAAPTALAGVSAAYNGVYGTLDTRANLLGSVGGLLSSPGQLLCGLLGQPSAANGLCSGLDGLLDGVTGLLGLGGGSPRTAVADATPTTGRSARSVAEMLAVTP